MRIDAQWLSPDMDQPVGGRQPMRLGRLVSGLRRGDRAVVLHVDARRMYVRPLDGRFAWGRFDGLRGARGSEVEPDAALLAALLDAVLPDTRWVDALPWPDCPRVGT